MLLDRRRRSRMVLYVSSDEHGIELRQVADVALIAPRKKLPNGVRIRSAGVFVADVGREEFQEAPRRVFAGAHNQSWQPVKAGAADLV